MSDQTNNINQINSKLNNLGNMSYQELVLLATSISLAITENRSLCEIKTLINLINLIEDNLVSILSQKNICTESIDEIIT